MKSLLIFNLLLVPFLLTAQQPMDTSFPTGGCLRGYINENYNFYLDDGVMRIYGQFSENCCGENMLLYGVSNDTISISKNHEGEYCYCICPYPFDLSIQNCSLNNYHVLIPESNIDTIIYAQNQTVGLDIQARSLEKLRIYPNPTTGECTILLPSPEADTYTAKIFGINGKLIKEFNKNAIENITLDCSTFSKGIYFVRIFGTKQNQYNGKIFVN